MAAQFASIASETTLDFNLFGLQRSVIPTTVADSMDDTTNDLRSVVTKLESRSRLMVLSPLLPLDRSVCFDVRQERPCVGFWNAAKLMIIIILPPYFTLQLYQNRHRKAKLLLPDFLTSIEKTHFPFFPFLEVGFFLKKVGVFGGKKVEKPLLSKPLRFNNT